MDNNISTGLTHVICKHVTYFQYMMFSRRSYNNSFLPSSTKNILTSFGFEFMIPFLT